MIVPSLRCRVASLLFLLLLTTSASSVRPAQAQTPARWDRFVTGVIETWFLANPPLAVYQGRHEFDGRFPDWSDAGLDRWVARLHALRDSASAFRLDPADSARTFERGYVVATIQDELFWVERADWPHRNPTWYTDQLDLEVYLTREYAPLADRLRAYSRWAAGLPAAVARIKANLRTPLPRPYLDIGRLRFGGMATYLEQAVPQVFKPVRDAALQADFTRHNGEAIRALREMDAWLAGQQAGGPGSFALGASLFQEMLHETEGVDVPAARLEAVGRADLERNLAALRAACASYAPGATPQECVQRVQATKPKDGPVEEARRQLVLLEAFVRQHGVASVPGTERALVREAPPYQRSNPAYISIPGPYEKSLPSIYYIAAPDPSWTPEERAAYIPGEASLLFTSVHEVWPGHFLQFLHANRARSTFGRVFVGYAFAEGWAHYAEEMMWESGLGKGSAEVHIGQLLDALVRDVRYLSAIGLHTRGMTVAESERMFRQDAFKDPGNARQQAARGTYDPAYLNYTLGKLMIRRLRDDWTASRGGRRAWRRFHDQFLSYGGPPIPMVRAAMLGPNAGPALGGETDTAHGTR